ncbi:MAG: polyribonucleotide nucleotidyltransferase [Spirochaetaceae bacterium]|nr:MAG: polyribonucleotide nucleotidyltransferase [Spirochaetaceae bacterium]
MFEVKEVRVKVGESELVLETGKMAKQANGSVTARMEGSIVLATATCSSSIREDLDFVPLSVEYNEKYYAAGKIPGGFLKREGRPKDKEILVCRLIDRPMRPLFSKSFKREIQVIPTVISTDQVNPPDVVAMCAASAAVTISDIPFDGPVGAVRVGYLNGEYIINPTFEQIAEGQLDILVAGTVEGITMVEGGGDEVEEEILLKAIEIAHETIIKICEAQNQLRELAGKEKLPLLDEPAPLEKEKEILDYARPKMKEACFVLGKFERSKAVKSVKTETLEKFRNDIPEDLDKQFSSLIEKLEQEIVRESILKDKQRTDGRGPEDIRPITCEIDVLPRTHGAALFTRGETQAMAVTTLGTVYDEQIMDDIEGDRRENFMLHYNFPPFCVGETGRMGTGRREIGHGHLAFRALAPMLPGKSAFPYTIRVVSEVLESNGSSSMATVCGGSLSLLNAGVPLKNPVAGIAMGLVTDGNDSVVISDILGEEDHLGDMDFKVAGTRKGITAFQMDIKVKRIQPAVMKQALEQAHRGRQHILDIMDKVIAVPRESLSEYAPRIITFKVDPEKIGLLIGPGGKTIKGINEKYSVETNIDNDGSVTIYCRESKSAEQAKAAFMGLLEEPEIGKQYDGVVRRIVDFGAFIEFLPGKEGLCHISKMSSDRINDVKDVLQLNQEVPVRIIEIDKMGRVNLSLIYEGSDMPSESSSNRGRDSRPPRATRRN